MTKLSGTPNDFLISKTNSTATTKAAVLKIGEITLSATKNLLM
jgi:hypothetical protein